MAEASYYHEKKKRNKAAKDAKWEVVEAAKRFMQEIRNYEWHCAAYKPTTPISAALFRYLKWHDCGAGGDFIDFRDEASGGSVLFTNTHKHYTDPPELVTGPFPDFTHLEIDNAYDLWQYCVERCVRYERNDDIKPKRSKNYC